MARRKDEKGAVALVAALTITMLLGVASLALDLGLKRVGIRDMQALADVVALDMARQIDGRTVTASKPTQRGWRAATTVSSATPTRSVTLRRSPPCSAASTTSRASSPR